MSTASATASASETESSVSACGPAGQGAAGADSPAGAGTGAPTVCFVHRADGPVDVDALLVPQRPMPSTVLQQLIEKSKQQHERRGASAFTFI